MAMMRAAFTSIDFPPKPRLDLFVTPLGIRKRRHLSPEEATAAALNFRRAKSPDLAPEIVPEAEDGQIPIQVPYEQK